MPEPITPDFPSPFRVETDKAVVAVRCARRGYLMIASRQEVFRYADIPEAVFAAARAWAETLEALGAARVYWLVLSEVTPHYHVHVFPRWNDEEPRGIPLFESRDTSPQPAWNLDTQAALEQWALKHQVEVVREA